MPQTPVTQRQAIAPLAAEVPIVDKDGKPSAQLSRLWEELRNRQNDSITGAQNATDMAGEAMGAAEQAQDTANDAGSPTGVSAGTFGSASQTLIIEVNEQGRIVSVQEEAIAGGSSAVYATGYSGGPISSTSTAAGATKGNIFIPLTDITLFDMTANVDPANTAQMFQLVLAEMDTNSPDAIVQNVLFQSTPEVGGATVSTFIRASLPQPIVLTAGTPYLFGMTLTNETAATGIRIATDGTTTNGSPIFHLPLSTDNRFYAFDSNSIQVGDQVDRSFINFISSVHGSGSFNPVGIF